ncbi:helix-turn-helix domain-containing protein [Paenibacillus ginsengarvi]|uniref:Helix-turn-helix domain-containing protein n=1 Tax=Paenibacillus ginsengarvi TaxID=400777 RepID=A0A3B0BRM3_9BACL|nr:helix-turn-helix domain-containing protein [Paenibacillus ginsengarvi]RKN74869.1 helix-turn-helix domain-containing protein [Paenibacillus ginsengarvi]
MRINRFLKWKWNSLFAKLLTSFLAMIVLFVSFHLLSLTFFKTNIRQEIIRYNTLGLDKTVDGYEKHFSLIQNDLLQMTFNEVLNAMAKPNAPYDYGAVASVLRQIQNMTNNSFLYLNNLIVYMPNQPYAIEKNGTSNVSDLFITNFASAAYSQSFWVKQAKEKYAFRVLPADSFHRVENTGLENDLGRMFPVVSKRVSDNNPFLLIALIDSAQLFERFHFSINDSFAIMDESGSQLFSQGDAFDVSAAMLPGGEGFTLKDGQYYFYKKGAYSGFTYVNRVPDAYIVSQASRLNAILLSIMAAAVLMGLIVSVILSYRFNNPIQRMIEGMKQSGRPPAIQSGIVEWNWIHETMANMAKSNREMSSDLTAKTSLLKQYGYLRGAKSLYPLNSIRDLSDTDKPFYLLVFQMAFTSQYREMTEETQEKASYFIQEFISLNIADQFADAVTVQAEKNQILTLVFGEEQPNKLFDVLAKLKLVFDRDKAYCQLTVAFHPKLLQASELAGGYEDCRRMLLQRKLTEDMEIVTEQTPYEEDPFLFLPSGPERELAAQLHAGEAEGASAVVRRLLGQMEQKGMNAHQFTLFSKEVASQLIKALLAHQLDVGELMESQSPYSHIQEAQTVADLERVLTSSIEETCRLIREKRDRHDPVKEFVLDYIEKHYNEDLSLETVAEQLQRSRSYLSTYLKEKTGMTFTDYVHDLRIRRAKEMLGGKDVRINEISERIGYQNVNSFIRMFKKICGVTPGEYRRVLIQEGDEPGRS